MVARLVDTYVARPANSTLPVLASLIARETEVRKVMARGLSNAEIGAELYLAEATVKPTSPAFGTSSDCVRDRVQAVVLAHDSGLTRS